MTNKIFGAIFISLLITIALAASPTTTYACSPVPGQPPYMIKDHVANSDFILLGKVINTTPFPPGDAHFEIYSVEVDVSTFYKGEGNSTVTIQSFGSGAACLQNIKVGENLIFFANADNFYGEIDFQAVYERVHLAAIEPTQENIQKVLEGLEHSDPQANDHILWSADMEEGTLYDWFYDDQSQSGGGVFNTGGDEVIAQASDVVAHSGTYSAEATITNAFQAQNGNRAVRLMRWTDKPWADGGDYFPADAYYSTWMYIPTTYNVNKYDPWDPGDGGWWNVFQFKSDDSNGDSQPMWVLNIDHNDETRAMSFYLYSDYNTPASHSQISPIQIPVGRWFHIEARYVQSSANSGSITFWQDGSRILHVDNVVTILDGNAVWGIGNYTDHIVGGEVDGIATVYFDDAIVSTQPTQLQFFSNSIYLPIGFIPSQ